MDRPHAAGSTSAVLTDPKRHRPVHEDPDLLVRVAVLGDVAVHVDFEQCERDLLAVEH